MKFLLEKVSEDTETKEPVLILRQVDGEDRLALNIQPREAQVLETLLGPDGLPGREVLDHLRNAVARSKGRVVGINLLLFSERSRDHPALTPVLIVQREGSFVEQAVPASLAHAAAWSLSLGLPFEIDQDLLAVLHGTLTIIPGAVPAGFRDVLAGMDDLDTL
ncbi:MAG: hypothetical protein HYY31_05735 [Chloroflexi bacterium]|nr:hypothetical protein [Chloroflexota bacterium]